MVRVLGAFVCSNHATVTELHMLYTCLLIMNKTTQFDCFTCKLIAVTIVFLRWKMNLIWLVFTIGAGERFWMPSHTHIKHALTVGDGLWSFKLVQASIFRDKRDQLKIWSTFGSKAKSMESIHGFKRLCAESCFPVTTQCSLWTQDEIKTFIWDPLRAHDGGIDEGDRPLFQTSQHHRQSLGPYWVVARTRFRQESGFKPN